jgi:hypothetical protein
MTNIWAGIYKEIRDPFFEIADPYTLNEKKEKEEKGEKEEKNEKEEKGEKEGKEDSEDKPKRWWDDDGDGKGYEKGEVSGKFSKKKVKEERDLSSKTLKNDKVDVRSGIKNKIQINPSVEEEVNAWIDELISEGYDLSTFTWDEVADIYESVNLTEAGTSAMPPKGDAVTVTRDPLESARRRAAQAQVRKEIADTQLARAKVSTNKGTNESVIAYLLDNNYIFEGVYDPKKGKLRPASERTKTEMSDADRRAAKKKQSRDERLEQEADKILNKMRSGSSKRSSAPMGTKTPEKKEAPEANRKLPAGRKQDTLAKKASSVLKDTKDK